VTDRTWFRNAVVYQIYPRSFADANGDGIGDLRGITAKLDHLAHLGVDVLWLSPVYRSPQDDNGYDISDYQDIDPLFGTLADFDELLAESHRRGIKLLMDLVVNHSSDEHPWFVESRSSRTNPKRDWYWWRPARPGTTAGERGAEPTNWVSWFSGSAWQLDETTGEYYLHLFSRKQPDLSWENPEVRQAVYAMMRWWLDRGVDGFRMDVVNLLSKVLPLQDGRVAPGEPWGDGRPFVCSGPRIHEFLHEMYVEVFRGRPGQFLTVGEMPGVTVDDARLFTDPAREEVDMVFQFEHMNLDHGGTRWNPVELDLRRLKATLGRWQDGLAEVGWNSLYWNNHDQARAVSRFGDDGVHRVASAKALGTLLHLHRGTPYVYQGEEIGMTNAPFATIDDVRDIESLNAYAVGVAMGRDPEPMMRGIRRLGRDNARTPVQWTADRNAGFTTGEPWIAVNPNHTEINVAAAVADSDSVFHHYRRLIELRHTEPAVAEGDFHMLLPDHPTVYAFTRTHGDTELLVVVNVASEPSAATVPGGATWNDAETVVYTAGPGSAAAAPFAADGTVTLAPWEARVLRRG
jgi:oligo-1,6-glucosidase